MSDIRLLIVDGNSAVRSSIREHADAEGYHCDEAADGVAALKLFRRNDYNAVILDTSLSELDGVSVCLQIRKMADVPIIIISENKDEKEKLLCFEFGADDYVIKPLSYWELMARVKVFLRRSGNSESVVLKKLSFGGLYIDLNSRTVYVKDKAVELTPKEYELLLFLSRHPNKAFSRNMLLNEVWGYEFSGSDRTVDTHIKTIRRSIKPYEDYIATVWGFGYRFEA